MEKIEEYLGGSKRVLALCGAGLSIPSGFPSLRTVCEGAMDIVTREAWDTDPAAVWQYYTARRRQATAAKPNPAHRALSALAKKLGPQMLTVSHTVDDLQVQANEAAGAPSDSLVTLLGDVFGLKCTNFRCHYAASNHSDPLTPALDPSEFGSDFYIAPDDLPKCPLCGWMLRPDCIWFGDALSNYHLRQIDEFILGGVDLVLLIGMSGTVLPTAGFVEECKTRGAQIAVFNIDDKTNIPGSWFFPGDVTETLPSAIGS